MQAGPEMSNPRNNYAVIVVKRKISCLCSLFLGKGGSVTATVTGRRRLSVDLLQWIYYTNISRVQIFVNWGTNRENSENLSLAKKYSYGIEAQLTPNISPLTHYRIHTFTYGTSQKKLKDFCTALNTKRPGENLITSRSRYF